MFLERTFVLWTQFGSFILLKAKCEICVWFADNFSSWKVKEGLKILKKITCHHRIVNSKGWTVGNNQTFPLGILTAEY